MNQILKQVLVILVGIGILVGAFFGLNGVRERNVSKIAIDKFSDVIGDVDTVKQEKATNSLIVDKFSGYDHNGELVAYMYEVNQSNGYGSISVLIAIDLNGRIVGMKANQVNQTLQVEKITEDINNFRGNINDEIDGLAGVTYAKNTINEILNAVAEDFNKEVK